MYLHSCRLQGGISLQEKSWGLQGQLLASPAWFWKDSKNRLSRLQVWARCTESEARAWRQGRGHLLCRMEGLPLTTRTGHYKLWISQHLSPYVYFALLMAGGGTHVIWCWGAWRCRKNWMRRPSHLLAGETEKDILQGFIFKWTQMSSKQNRSSISLLVPPPPHPQQKN